MYIEDKILVGKGKTSAFLLPSMANRHGLIAGATGTGKTVTLKVLAESFSDAGVPVFLADVKGDLSGTLEAGAPSPKLEERLHNLGIEEFEFSSHPVAFWDVFCEKGLPVRTTISEMGPMLLSRLLELNETQSSILSIIFRIADDMQMLLLDYKDLKKMVQYVSNNAASFKNSYGNLSSTSIASILRKMIAFEEEGANLFFGEEALNIYDLIQIDQQGRGQINILNAEKLYHKPKIYSTFLLWLISELFEELPEAGDLEKPKLVFFFDEAHLLFDSAPKVLTEKIEQVVRLIRSKGIGIYFITQNPADIPDNILGQLGNKVQHALRAFTPKDQKSIRAAAQSFRTDGTINVETEITNLKVGEALISFLDEEGRPSIVDIATILPPSGKMGPADSALLDAFLRTQPLYAKYGTLIDRESAYELLQAKIKKEEEDEQKLAEQAAWEKQKAKEQAQLEKERAQLQKKKNTSSKRASNRDTLLETGMKQVTRSVAGSFGRQIGNQLVRGLFGSLTKR